jgi:toxin ParE1/3/4
MNVDFSPRAITDLESILEFIAQYNPQAAVRLIDSLEARCEGLAAFPSVGTKRDDLAPGLRALSHGNYVIYFLKETAETLRIVRVFHGARDVKPIDFRPGK